MKTGKPQGGQKENSMMCDSRSNSNIWTEWIQHLIVCILKESMYKPIRLYVHDSVQYQNMRQKGSKHLNLCRMIDQKRNYSKPRIYTKY